MASADLPSSKSLSASSAIPAARLVDFCGARFCDPRARFCAKAVSARPAPSSETKHNKAKNNLEVGAFDFIKQLPDCEGRVGSKKLRPTGRASNEFSAGRLGGIADFCQRFWGARI